MYTDSHCHITCDRLYARVDEIIQNIQTHHVTSCMIMSTNQTEFERAKVIKEQYPFFKLAFGWFPGDAKEMTDAHLTYLENEIQAGHLDCLGEIGLDYHWDTSFKDAQKQLFVKQLEIANTYHLPVSIHMRDATKDCMDLLRQHAHTRIIFHCFSGSPETMQEALKMDSVISFAGPITFKNSRQGPACVKACPADRILSETDSPYFTPVPHRGHENEPMYVRYVAEKIAELKDMEVPSLCAQIEKNFAHVFA